MIYLDRNSGLDYTTVSEPLQGSTEWLDQLRVHLLRDDKIVIEKGSPFDVFLTFFGKKPMIYFS